MPTPGMRMAATSPTRPTRVTAKNYRTWAELDWPLPAAGVVLVRGRNLDAQRSTTSAVGKTSLLSSIAYALGVGPPTTHTKSWGEEESCVTLDVELGDVCQVARGTGRLLLKTPARLYEGRSAEEELRRRLGDPEILRALTWRKQRARGNFFSLKPAPRREFLAKLLGLVRLEEASEASRRDADKAKDRFSLQEAQLRTAEEEIIRLRAIEPPVPEPPDQSLAESLREYERTLAQGQSRPPPFPPELGELRRLAAELSKSLASKAVQHREAIQWLERERQRARGRCGECGQPVAAEGAQPEYWQARVVELEASIRHDQEELALGGQAASFLEEEHRQTIEGWRASSEAGRTELEQVRLALSELSSAQLRFRTDVEARNRWIGAMLRATEAAARARQALDESQSLEARNRDFAALLRSYVVAVFEEVLTDLSTTANAILGRVPNVSDCSLNFCFEERAGKQEVGERVYVAGAERDRDDLSGGQEAAFELAVDLALFDVVFGRGIVRPTWMVLDEPFDGMGSPDREAFLEYMQSRPDRLHLIIDHSREFGEIFIQSGVGVEKKDGRSRLVSGEELANW